MLYSPCHLWGPQPWFAMAITPLLPKPMFTGQETGRPRDRSRDLSCCWVSSLAWEVHVGLLLKMCMHSQDSHLLCCCQCSWAREEEEVAVRALTSHCGHGCTVTIWNPRLSNAQCQKTSHPHDYFIDALEMQKKALKRVQATSVSPDCNTNHNLSPCIASSPHDADCSCVPTIMH